MLNSLVVRVAELSIQREAAYSRINAIQKFQCKTWQSRHAKRLTIVHKAGEEGRSTTGAN